MTTRVRVELIDNIYRILDADTSETVGTSANDLSLLLHCQANKWSLLNPPKRTRQRKQKEETKSD